jgi:HEAT repeat protein
MGPDAKRIAISALVELLQAKDGGLRGNAAIALGEIGPEAKAAIPALTKAVQDPEWFVRFHAREALKKTGKENK